VINCSASAGTRGMTSNVPSIAKTLASRRYGPMRRKNTKFKKMNPQKINSSLTMNSKFPWKNGALSSTE